MTPLELRCVEAMARGVYEEQRIDHDGIQWELLPKNSYERAALISEARAALTALLTELNAAGWQVVPKIATDEMTISGTEAFEQAPESYRFRDDLIVIYPAMLAAAPKPFKGPK